MNQPPLPLDGRVVVVVGAGSSGAGLSNGEAAALAYAAAGAVVVAVDLNGVTDLHAALAITTLVVLALWTSFVTRQTIRRRATATWLVPADVALAALVASMDHLVYDGPHPQTFGSSWPLGAVVTAGILRGRVPTAGGIRGISEPCKWESFWPIWRPTRRLPPERKTRRSMRLCFCTARFCINPWENWAIGFAPNDVSACPWC